MPPRARKHLAAIAAAAEEEDDAPLSNVTLLGHEEPVQESPEDEFIREDGSASPDAPVWQIKVSKRVRANHAASFVWQHAVTYSNERWSDWTPQPPISRVERDCGTGDFRFDVYLRSKRARVEQYPEMAGAQSFYIPHPTEMTREQVVAAATPATPPAPVAAPPQQQQVDMPALVRSVADAMRPAAGAATSSLGGGISQELHTSITMTKEKADRLERLFEQLGQQRATEDKENIKLEAARAEKHSELVRQIDALTRKVEALEKRDPVGDIAKLKAQAEALGFESGGQVGLWKEGIGALRDIITHKGGAAAAGLPGSPQKVLENPEPQAPAGRHWHTQDGGEWMRLGDLVHWIGREIVEDRNVTTDQIIFKAFELLGSSETDSRWLSECSAEDIKKLFVYVWGESHALIAHWGKIAPHVETVLGQYPIFVANKMADAKRAFPAWLTAALEKRGATPPAKKAETPNGSKPAVLDTTGRQPAAAAGGGAPATTA